jgi:DDB1- and CUL4-associated factor 13
MEAMNFAVANEDHNIYIFDARKFDRASNILKGHVHVRFQAPQRLS